MKKVLIINYRFCNRKCYDMFPSESLCGIFVKKVVEGSVADVQGRILPNDQVIEVNSICNIILTLHDRSFKPMIVHTG